MNQKGDGSNNTQIGSIGGEASVTINQHSEKREPEYTKLEPDYSTELFVDKIQLRQSAQQFHMKIVGGGLLSLLAVSADMLGLSTNLGFPVSWIIPIPLFAGALLAWSHAPDWRRFKNKPADRYQATFVGEDEVMEDAGDMWHFYKLSAACIYPHCKGKIILTAAPSKERALKTRSYVGICSACGRDHSYRIDSNGVATRAPNMDWREPEKARAQST